MPARATPLSVRSFDGTAREEATAEARRVSDGAKPKVGNPSIRGARYMSRYRQTSGLRALSIGLVICGGCSPGDDIPTTSWEAVRDTVGDTVIVRTVSGSVWGDTAELVPEVSIGMLDGPEEYMLGSVVSLATGSDGTIYAMDRQVPALRVYEPDGTYRTTFGRPGEGPGEYEQPDGGLNVLSDDRVLLRDPANARIQVYAPDGEPLDEWRIRGGLSTGSRMVVDTLDRTHTIILLDAEADVRDWRMGLVRLSSEGVPGDTLEAPDAGFQESRIEARFSDGEGNTGASISNVPFSATEETALSPHGYWIHGISTDYEFTLLKPEGPLRIVRVHQPVPVTRGERTEEEALATRNMRRTEPGWEWDAEPIPDHKPPYQGFYAGEDGTIWVRVSQPGVKREDPDFDPSDPESIADEWFEPWLFDVFDENGSYLGAVRAPDGFRTYPVPIFTREWVLGTVRDEYDVQSVVRFRVEFPGLEPR